MNSYELNKIFGAVLGTLLFVMGVGFIAEEIYHPIEGRAQGYNLPEPELTVVGEAPEVPQVEPISVRLLTADASNGEAAVRRCQSCHTFEQGGAHRAGPNLWDTLGLLIGGHEGYSYSPIFEELRAAGETWTYENLDAFLESPAGFAPGTRMTFSGVNNPAERADMLAYFQTLSTDPVPFPEPPAAPIEESVVPAIPTEEGDVTPTETPVVPVEAIDTPATTQSETSVQGSPTGPGQPGTDPANQPAPVPQPGAAAPANGGVGTPVPSLSQGGNG